MVGFKIEAVASSVSIGVVMVAVMVDRRATSDPSNPAETSECDHAVRREGNGLQG